VALAFVLPEEVAGNGPVTFPGFPGVWTPGVPIEAQALIDAGAAETAEELQKRCPPQLEEVDVAPYSAPLPLMPNHIPAEALVTPPPALADMSHAELDEKAAELGLEPFAAKTTRAVKIEAIEAAQDEAAAALASEEL
jgi:hypothetical protein